jgi:hypothetical protein
VSCRVQLCPDVYCCVLSLMCLIGPGSPATGIVTKKLDPQSKNEEVLKQAVEAGVHLSPSVPPYCNKGSFNCVLLCTIVYCCVLLCAVVSCRVQLCPDVYCCVLSLMCLIGPGSPATGIVTKRLDPQSRYEEVLNQAVEAGVHLSPSVPPYCKKGSFDCVLWYTV